MGTLKKNERNRTIFTILKIVENVLLFLDVKDRLVLARLIFPCIQGDLNKSYVRNIFVRYN